MPERTIGAAILGGVTPDTDRLKADIAAAWDAGAPAYDATPRHGIRHDDEWRAWRRLVAAILGDPTHADVPRLRVLDVGTGTGTLALLASELGHDVVGVDLSPGMLAEARRKAASAGLAVRWELGDAERLPDELGPFDAVMSRHLLWTLPRPDVAVAVWRSVLAPSGLVAVIDGYTIRLPAPLSLGQRLAASLVGWRERRAHGPDHTYPSHAYAALPLRRQRDTRAITQLLQSAGLERVRVRSLPEVDRIERGHLGPLERLADNWRQYLATGRNPASAETG